MTKDEFAAFVREVVQVTDVTSPASVEVTIEMISQQWEDDVVAAWFLGNKANKS